MLKFRSILGLFASLVAGTLALPADTVRIPASADTALFSNNPENNLGGMTFLPIGVNQVGDPGRGLLQFDLAGQVPFGAVVTEAALTLRVTYYGGSGSRTYQVHRLLHAWGEGDKTGQLPGTGLGQNATDGEATWLARFHPDTLWSSPGGSVGEDFVDAPSASQSIGGADSYTFNSSQLAADVTAWLANPSTNHGWIVLVQNESIAFGSARRFASREDPNPDNAPALTITFTLPGRMENPEVVGEDFRFQFLAKPDHSYVVQRQEVLKSELWTTITNIPAPPSETNLLIADPLNSGPRFYRIQLQ